MENIDLSAELMEKARACKSVNDLIALAKEEGFELSEEALEAVSAGGGLAELADLASCKDNRVRLALASSLALANDSLALAGTKGDDRDLI